MKKENNPVSQEKFKTLIGGQALIEGIMMQGPDKRSIVVRGPEGLVTKVEPLKKRTGVAKWPLIRGVVNFASSMVSGVKALMYSAEFFPEEEEDAQPSKFEQWLEKKLGSEKLEKAVVSFSVFLGVLFSVGLFFLLPTLLGFALCLAVLALRKRPLAVLAGPALVWVLSLAAPVSWMVLSKAHAYVHVHLVPMLWHFALVPVSCALLVWLVKTAITAVKE